MTSNEIKRILFEHEAWLNGSGVRADLRYADLRGADLGNANLSNADLRYADLRGADLGGANLRDADLRGANLRGANLRDADLSYADLRISNLSYANLSNADLRGADLRNAYLSGVRLIGVQYDESTVMLAMACPEKGAFIGYKKAGGYIVELLILEDARRSSATSRKCRCDKARVLSITNLDGQDAGVDYVCSNWDPDFIYNIGSVVEEPDFCTDRWRECAPGIHFFLTRGEAVNYG